MVAGSIRLTVRGISAPARASFVLRPAALAAVAAGPAAASTIIDRNASGVGLQVNRAGEALVSYRAQGKQAHVLAWGALNAIAPTRARTQVAFKLDYSGGYQAHY